MGLNMSELEEKEYDLLADKRENNTMTNKEHKRWIQLVNKSFSEGLPKVVQAWKKGFNL